MPETLGLTHPSIYSEMLKSEDSLTLELLSDKLHSVTHFGTVPDRSSEAKPSRRAPSQASRIHEDFDYHRQSTIGRAHRTTHKSLIPTIHGAWCLPPVCHHHREWSVGVREADFDISANPLA